MAASRYPESHLNTLWESNAPTFPARSTRSTAKARIVGVAIWLNGGPEENGQPTKCSRPKTVLVAIKLAPTQTRILGVTTRSDTLPVSTVAGICSGYWISHVME